ncbi:helix-turn-helix transcriptional regulator [Bifidobacterium pseudocatenulatum]|uniref:helix-turn-helix transcriptional regulator n=1 Tax=Bifidobacterium pseudocatenulatum TaxID=28026 RepID=UPI003DA47BC7
MSTTGTPPSSSQQPSSPTPAACTPGGNEMTARYLSLKEVAKRLGVTNAVAYRLPKPDALIESTRGWKPKTIDA